MKQTHRTNLWLLGEGWAEGIDREIGRDRYTLLYLKLITNKDLLYSTQNSAQCYVAAWMGGESVWLSTIAVPLKLSQHC